MEKITLIVGLIMSFTLIYLGFIVDDGFIIGMGFIHLAVALLATLIVLTNNLKIWKKK